MLCLFEPLKGCTCLTLKTKQLLSPLINPRATSWFMWCKAKKLFDNSIRYQLFTPILKIFSHDTYCKGNTNNQRWVLYFAVSNKDEDLRISITILDNECPYKQRYSTTETSFQIVHINFISNQSRALETNSRGSVNQMW